MERQENGIMVFKPTMKEFRDFAGYVTYMESCGAHRYGIAKVIPPKEWSPKGQYDDLDDLAIPSPISQVVTGQHGAFQQLNIEQKSLTYKKFRELALSDRYKPPKVDSFEDLERKYWKNITYNPPIYGADVPGSLYHPSVKTWNVNCLESVLDELERQGVEIPGVNTAYLYFGMWKTSFAWHTEDLDLYSINYLHFGEPKSWYAIPPKHGKRLESLAKSYFPGESMSCSSFLRHKMTIISPSLLNFNCIPVNKMLQREGEFMITFPYGYHAGFNCGFNCAESTNFALERWLEFGQKASRCYCRNDGVNIDMTLFSKIFKPSSSWRQYAGRTRSGVSLSQDDDIDLEECSPNKASISAQRTPRVESQSVEKTPRCLPKKGKMTGMSGQRIKRPSSKVPASPRKLETSKSVLTSSAKKTKHMLHDQDGPPKKKAIKLVIQKQTVSVLHGENEVTSSKTPVEEHIQPITGLPVDDVVGLWQHHLHNLEVEQRWNDYICDGGTTCAICSLFDLTQEVNTMPDYMLKYLEGGSGAASMASTSATTNGSATSNLLTAPEGDSSLSSPQELRQGDRQSSPVCREGRESVSPARDRQSSSPAPDLISKAFNICVDRMSLYTEYCNSSSDSSSPNSPVVARKSSRSPDCIRRKSIEKRLWDRVKLCEHNYAKEYCSDDDAAAKLLATHTNGFSQLTITGPTDVSAKVAVTEETSRDCPLTDTQQDKEASEQSSYKHTEGSLQATNTRENSREMHCGSNRPVASTASSCPAISLSAPVPGPEEPLSDDDGGDILFCQKCHIAVHASCFGVLASDRKPDWLCPRCAIDAAEAECCLCCMRGGALKRTDDGRWAHIVCAVSIPEVFFGDHRTREPICVSGIPGWRWKMKCFYCQGHGRPSRGALIQCSLGKCRRLLHVTCAYRPGVQIVPGDWPVVLRAVCDRHRQSKAVKRPFVEFAIGQSVYAKHKNCRYYKAQVDDIIPRCLFEVIFDDYSYSNNLLPEDIVSHNCAEDGPPGEGEVVSVLWTDGKEYGAKFIRTRTQLEYQVVFEDGSSRVLQKEYIFDINEDLPKRVADKLSTAQESQEHFAHAEEAALGKRKRRPSRFLNDS